MYDTQYGIPMLLHTAFGHSFQLIIIILIMMSLESVSASQNVIGELNL